MKYLFANMESDSLRLVGGWIYCEDGYNLPPTQEAVPALVRTRNAIVIVPSAFWFNPLYASTQLQGKQLTPELIQKFHDALRWQTFKGTPLHNVVAWYAVPAPGPIELAKLLSGQDS